MFPGLSRVGPYSVLRPLGAGGMAETFVAERRGPGAFVQRVCLKRIRADMASDPELVRQFMAEAAIAARLRHATIASVLDFGEEHGVLYMAIELIDGVDLREVIKHAPLGLPASLVVYIAVELCTALDVAHGSSVVHRDVSPSNVLVSTEGEVKLADFGIARAETGPSHTRTGIVRGKVPYMAPEYARTARFDARADLFSLGVLLHECAYGERPFDGATDLETLERATRGERIAVPARAEPLPDGFESILEHLLHPDPDQRFATATAALEALLSLPSDPRARRELGVRVSALQPEHAESTTDASFASTALAAAIGSNQPTHTLVSEPLALPRRKPGRWIAATLAALALVGAVTMWLKAPDAAAKMASAPPSGPPSTAPSTPSPPSAPAEPRAASPASPAPDDPVLRPVAAAAAPESDEPAAAPAPATLDIAVVPYGQVFLNDKLVGDAPLNHLKLRAGSYRIRAELSNGTSVSKRVVLRAGERRRIKLE